VKEKLKTHPLTIAIDASSSAFQFYRDGVISTNSNCGESLNHAVVVVGYTEVGDNTPTPSPTPEPVDNTCTVYKWWHSCDSNDDRRRL